MIKKLLRPFTPNLLISVLVAVLLVQYFSITDLWWMFDDTQHLKLVNLQGLKVFTHSAAEVGYMPANFTPWLFLNYWIDLTLFGLDPRGAHFHQLLSLSFTVIAAFYLLKQIMTPIIAVGALLIFFSTPVAHTVIHILCTRHYLEGLAYACLALTLYLRYRNSARLVHLFFSVIFAFIAFLNKEVYLPLVGIVVCVSFFDFIESRNANKLIPATFFTLATVLYFCYRGYALGWGNIITGYGSAVSHRGPIEILIYLKELLVFNHLGFLAALLAVLLLTFAVRKIKAGVEIYIQLKFLTLLMLGFACVLVPVYKVMPTANINHNYLFVATFSLVAASGYFLSKLLTEYPFKSSKMASAVIFIALVYTQQATALPNSTLNVQNRATKLFDKHKVEGMYLLYSKEPASNSLVDAAGAPWHQSGILDLRKQYLQLPAGPTICIDACNCIKNGTVHRYTNGKLEKLNKSELKCELE